MGRFEAARFRPRVRSLADLSFTSGYAFFVPYAVLYVLGWVLAIPTELLRHLFAVLHALNLLLLAVFVWDRRHSFRRPDAAFWLLLFVAFHLPGAYLEYAADPWEHLRRIFLWATTDVVGDHDSKWKFAYFWGYSWMAALDIPDRRIALDAYSTFWQLLTAAQLYALARRLGFDATWSKVHVVAYFLFIGIGPLNFRHHALSSTPLAYVAFLRAVICCIDFTESRKPRALAELPLLLALALINHRQEVMFIGISGGAILALDWFGRQSAGRRRQLLRALAIAWVLCLVAGTLAMQLRPDLYAEGFEFQLTWFGGFRIWQRWYFLNVWGVHGVIATLLGVWLLASQRRIGVLTLLPPLLLLTPPLTLAITWLLHGDAGPAASHRFLFAFPWSVALVEGTRRIVRALGMRLAVFRHELWITLTLLLLFALPPTYPWQGRLFYALHRPPDDLTLRYIDETAAWFDANRDVPKTCRILTDAASQFGLLAHLGHDLDAYVGYRVKPPNHSRTIQRRAELVALIRQKPTCGVLVGIEDELPAVVASPISELSRHWDHRLATPRLTTGDGFRRAAEGLRALGWTRTRVPPFYWYYEPPNSTKGVPQR